MNCSIFPAAVPFFPSTIVAACPNLTPGILSTKRPATKAIIGVLICFEITSSESFSSITPPGSEKITIASVPGSLSKSGIRSRKFEPTTGSPPILIHVLCPISLIVRRLAISVVMPPLLDAMATVPGIYALLTFSTGPPAIPILTLWGLIMPRVLGPITTASFSLATSRISIVSLRGTLSATITNNLIPLDKASRAAPFIIAGGTEITLASAGYAFKASKTVLKTDTP